MEHVQKCLETIRAKKKELGSRLIVLGHHYQRMEIIGISDIIGDSFELSRRAAAQQEAEFIIFCGVHFMAESADVLSPPGRKVILPDLEAGCPMADMADLPQVEAAWQQLGTILGGVPAVPIVYMNSAAAIKAFCGRNGGAVCTSSNAQKVFRWAFEREKPVLFFPDEHLGRNTAREMGIPSDKVVVWNPYSADGGVTAEELARASVILWKGFCIVHQHFTVEDVERVRQEHPKARIYVHPECREEVVKLVDGSGSTSYLVQVAEQAQPNEEICIGTEVNLVDRLAATLTDRTIFPLRRSECRNMSKITPAKVLHCLDHLGEINVVNVDAELRDDSHQALQRMLDICV